MKHAYLAWVVAVAGCGDDLPDLPPEVASSHLELTTAEDGTISIDAAAFDPEHRSLTYTFTAPDHGTITGTGPHFTYTPEADFWGKDTVTITASDGSNTVDIVVDLMVAEVNDAPVAADRQATIDEDQALAVGLFATDVDGPTLHYAIDSPPTHGTLTGAPPNITYTPDLHYFGGDAFTFEASDGSLRSRVATVTIAVIDVIACGDGVMEGAEQCDDGNDDNTDACLDTCVAARCGDGFVELGVEQCDDGNTNNNDACRNNCTHNGCGIAVGESEASGCAAVELTR
jgi:cysteine-rich repeat protein